MLLRLAPALFVFLWSSGFIATKLAITGAEPFTLLAIRFALVLALLVPAALWLARTPLSPSEKGHAMVAGALMHGGYLGGVSLGVWGGMNANVTALICSLQPVLTAILAGLFLGEVVTGRHWAGLATGLVGAAMVILPKIAAPAASGTITAGNLSAVVFALLAITIGTIYQKRNAAGIDLINGAVWQFIGALAVVTPLSFALETRTVVWSAEFVFALAWLVLVLSLGAITLLMLLIRANAVSQTSALFYLVPGVTSLMALMLFGETLNLIQAAGIVLVMGAVIMMQPRAPVSQPPPGG